MKHGCRWGTGLKQVSFGKARFAVALLAVTALGACTAAIRNHGYIPPEEVLDEIVVGVDTRATVEDTAGSPTALGMVDDSGFYYVRSRMRSFAFTAPQVVEREVLAITFDEAGVVQNIERFGLEEGRVITLERRVTEVTGVRGTFLRQLLRNLGRFAPGTFGSNN